MSLAGSAYCPLLSGGMSEAYRLIILSRHEGRRHVLPRNAHRNTEAYANAHRFSMSTTGYTASERTWRKDIV